jgi:predicted nucleic acid-binding protein
MARYFLDSSALVKRYHQERGSSEVADLLNKPDNRFFVSRLALVEIHSAFARLVREQTLSESDFKSLILRLDADVASGLFSVAAISSRRLDSAALLLRTQGLTQSLRTLDAIQLATAQALNNRSTLAAFIAADKKLLASATAGGFVPLDVG